MQTLNRPPSEIDNSPAPQLRKPISVRTIIEFLLFFVIALLLLEPILALSGISFDSSRRGAVCKHAPPVFRTKRKLTSSYEFNYSNVLDVIHSTKHPDVVVLGSSLVLWPALECDGIGTPYRPGFPSPKKWNFHRYRRAEYFRNLLGAKLGRNISILENVGVSGSSMEDHTLIFDVAVRQGKRPKLMILALNPTQFVATKTFLPEYRPLSMELRPYTREKRRDSSLEILRDRFCMNIFDQVMKAKYLASAAQGGKLGEIIERSLYQYENGFEQSYHRLAEMQQIAKRYDIPLLVVDMPVKSKTYVSEASLTEYRRRVREISQKHGTPYFDLNKMGSFTAGHFADSLHLNEQGARKLYALISEIVASDPRVNRKLRTPKIQP